MNLFPFFENIEGRRFLIIGGGRTAKQKLSVLRRFTDRITVVAEETDLAADAGFSRKFRVLRKRFAPEDLELGDYIVAATGDRTLNREISQLAKESGKPVNVVDDPELCTFFFPALVRRGGLVVAVSTSGKSPAYAGYLRRELEERLPENIEEILDTLESCRRWLPEVLPEQKERGVFLKELMQGLLRGEVSCRSAGTESVPQEIAASENSPQESTAPEKAAQVPSEKSPAEEREAGCVREIRALAEEFRDRRRTQ